MSKLPIIILGGGPTGLAAAYELARQNVPFILLEKEQRLGGLSSTINYKNFLYEYGPHAFHLKNPEITQWLQELLGADFRIIPTKTQVLIDGQFLHYPLNGAELLRKVRPLLGFKILIGYLGAYLKNLFFHSKAQNFEEWGLKNFGPTLYKISFGDYTEKVWGMNPQKISVKLASQKLSRLNLSDIILKLLGFKGKNQPAYFKKYLYPQNGAGEIFTQMRKLIEKKGKIIQAAEVEALENANHQIKAVQYQDTKGKRCQIPCQSVISTLVLKDLMPMIKPAVREEILRASGELRYRDLIIVYLVVTKKDFDHTQWIYLVEKGFIFNRVTIGENLSPRFAPKNKTVLAFEICTHHNDKFWQKKDSAILDLLHQDLKKLNLGNLKISDYFIRRLENAYPIFTVGFEKNLNLSHQGLSEIKNLIAAGRNGLFLNSDIHDCLELGFEASKMITKPNYTSKKWYQEHKLQ